MNLTEETSYITWDCFVQRRRLVLQSKKRINTGYEVWRMQGVGDVENRSALAEYKVQNVIQDKKQLVKS